MYKSDSHDSGVETHSHKEQLIKDTTNAQARRARRHHRANATTTNNDETKIEVPETHPERPITRHRRRPSPKDATEPQSEHPAKVTIENETKPTRKKKTFKAREGEDIEMNVKKRSDGQKQRKRTKSKEPHSDGEVQKDRNRNKILGICVHRTDRLKTDLRLQHPFVRVHLIDINTGSYIRKLEPNHSALHHHGINDQATDHIQAVTTASYDFQENRSSIPSWEDRIIIDESYSHFIAPQPNVVIFFEILEYIRNKQNPDDRSKTFPIAWAFLKLVGAQNNLNTERMVRLQLWEPFYHLHGSGPLMPDVVAWYNHIHRPKYPSTLYVTVKPLESHDHYSTGIRSVVEGDIEQMKKQYDEVVKDIKEADALGLPNYESGDPTNKLNPVLGPLQRVAQLPPRWQKLPHSKCKVPKERFLSFKTSDRGCSAVRFSHNGYFIACAEVHKLQENNLISIYEIPYEQRIFVFVGHLQIIYDLDWSKTDRYLASASADSFVKIWNFEEIQRKPWRSLAHPTYVYCVRFHPLIEDIVVTAGYDKMIRIWNIEKKHGTVIRAMSDHLGYISSISFNLDGTKLASVDSNGAIKTWHGLPHKSSSSYLSTDSWSLNSNLEFEELKNIPLNSIMYSPDDNFLLAAARDNFIGLIDVRLKTISRRYNGAFNLQDRIRATFSACGSLVFAGSEDGQVHCWHTYEGRLLHSYSNINYSNPVIDIQFHPLDNILAMCAVGAFHQVYVYQHVSIEADTEARPMPRQATPRGAGVSPIRRNVTPGPVSDGEHTPSRGRRDPYDSSPRHPAAASDTDRSFAPSRPESSGDELRPPTVPKDDTRNRRLAVVNKILDEMDDVIHSRDRSSRSRDSMADFAGGHVMSRSTERDVSPYQARRKTPTSGYTSDSNRPPLVSPLRNLTSPDLFEPTSNRNDDDDIDYSKSPSVSNQIMYATTNYKAQRPEELSFSKNDKIKILKRESHLLWYAEHMQTGTRGYVSPNRVHIAAKETYSHLPKSTVASADVHSISEIPRLDNSSRRSQPKSVKFDSSN